MLRHISWTQQFHTWTLTEILPRSREFHSECVVQVDIFAPNVAPTGQSRTTIGRLGRKWRMRNRFSALSVEANPVCELTQCFQSAVMVNSKLDYYGGLFPWNTHLVCSLMVSQVDSQPLNSCFVIEMISLALYRLNYCSGNVCTGTTS